MSQCITFDTGAIIPCFPALCCIEARLMKRAELASQRPLRKERDPDTVSLLGTLSRIRSFFSSKTLTSNTHALD